MQFAVVADGVESRVAEALTSALNSAGIMAVTWTSPMFVQNRARVVGQVRVLFLGECTVGKVMRRMVQPHWKDCGVRYGIKKRMGFLWTDDDVIDRPAAFRRMEDRLAELMAEAENKRALGRDAGHVTGALVAHNFLRTRRESPLMRLTGRQFDERMYKRQLEYGVARLLLHGFDAWLEIALTPIMQPPRTDSPTSGAAPRRRAEPQPSFVVFEESHLRNPTSSTAPPPPRRSVVPDRVGERAAVQRDLARVEEELAGAQRRMRVRTDALDATPVGAPDRRSRERELDTARRHVRSLSTKRNILKRQLDDLPGGDDRIPRP